MVAGHDALVGAHATRLHPRFLDPAAPGMELGLAGSVQRYHIVEKPEMLTGRGNDGDQIRSRKKQKGGAKAQGMGKIYLPPVRVVEKAQWGSASDRRALETATKVGHGYRPLPPGWEERAPGAV